MIRLKSGIHSVTINGIVVTVYIGPEACKVINPKNKFGLDFCESSPRDANVGEVVGWVRSVAGGPDQLFHPKDQFLADGVLCHVDHYNSHPDCMIAPIYRDDERLTWTVEISVSSVWVEDGFDLDQERVTDMVQNLITHAYSGEITGKVVSAPDAAVIRRIRGYGD